MKNYISFFILILGIISCNSDEDKSLEGNFEFTSKYSATVTVGGVVGIKERFFETGEVYKGSDRGKETIRIRIAEHSQLNDNCPNSMCYQEFLDVPRVNLKFVK
ncbi:hypothetical protein L1276_001884 [Flavobacterium sp. HSC-32F16]|uniref:hypothetical protein n=1 Tax=Flavobacterium sp. HSC-32F16 TaxID=2910964 RepID=UPI0020A26587|nr:hypothetical protein [Flavobacterium sp. HSC-32F16]MCP2026740.1 hypothetical protein [Flavobacterium sp. HSC-32F16]